MSKWTEQEEKEFHRLWLMNCTFDEIAISLNRSKKSIQGYVERSRRKGRLEFRIQDKVLSVIIGKQKREKLIEIEDPPRMVPIPDGALNIPWVDLERNQCQWGLSNDFFEPASNKFLCCGLKIVKDRCCEHHLKYRKKGWE